MKSQTIIIGCIALLTVLGAIAIIIYIRKNIAQAKIVKAEEDSKKIIEEAIKNAVMMKEMDMVK